MTIGGACLCSQFGKYPVEDFPLTVSISKQGAGGKQAVPVTYYPVFATDQRDNWPESDKRERHRALLEDASKVVHREDYLALIRQFETLSPWIKEAEATINRSREQCRSGHRDDPGCCN